MNKPFDAYFEENYIVFIMLVLHLTRHNKVGSDIALKNLNFRNYTSIQRLNERTIVKFDT